MRGVDRERQCEEEGEKGREGWGGGLDHSREADREIQRERRAETEGDSGERKMTSVLSSRSSACTAPLQANVARDIK